MNGSVLLINTNIARPPVSPVGLEYVGETLIRAKVPVQVLDLVFEADWKTGLTRELKEEPLLVAVTVRNTDDCCFATRRSFLPWISEVVAEIRRLSGAFCLLGGGGFSIMPETTLKLTRADAGIAGDGEGAVTELAKCLMNGKDISHLPNLVYQYEDRVILNPRVNTDLERLPVPGRQLFNNQRYEQLGAMVGIETKRGCTQRCIFCADPLAKGNSLRLRPPASVAQEFQALFSQGISWFHLGDSEFNLPLSHAKEVCRAIIQAGLGEKIRWYTYCSPIPFDRELTHLMLRAGCAGINFGVDSLCDEQLPRLDKSHTINDIYRLLPLLDGMNYMFDLLVGAPGETVETVKATVDKARELDIPLVGIAAGVRIYPETPLGQAVASRAIKRGLYPATGDKTGEPLFYLSPHLSSDVFSLISKLVAGDPRFLILATPAEDGSYNYADDETLSQLIKEGARGAYWDIIRQAKMR